MVRRRQSLIKKISAASHMCVMLWDTSYRYVAVPALCRCDEMTGCAQNTPVECLRKLFDSRKSPWQAPPRCLSASTFRRNSAPASNVCGAIPVYYHVQSASSIFQACPLMPNAQPLLVVFGNDDTVL